MTSCTPQDVRLVYIACAWLLAHRGHFFSDVAKEKVDELTDFSIIYSDFETLVKDHGSSLSWEHQDIAANDIGNI
jgi:CRISPR-associated endonuclease Csn1